MPSPLRFAIAGCGTIAPTHADALAAIGAEDALLTHCCDIDPEAARAFAARYDLTASGYADLLRHPEIDAVSICTPSGLHAELAMAALRAGKHAIVEKPMDITLEACSALRAAAERSGKTFAVISQHRYDPASRRARTLLDEGALGKLLLIDARICWYRTQEYYDSAGWRGTWEMDGGGCLMNQGVHTVDLMRWLGGEVETVTAQMRTAGHERIAVEDVVAASLTFKNGAVGTLSASTAAYPGFPARLALHGTNGTVVIEADALHTVAIKGMEKETAERAVDSAVRVAGGGTRSAQAGNEREVSGEVMPAWGDAHAAQLRDFIDWCRTGKRPLVDAEAGRDAVAVVLAVYESARTGKTVVMDEFCRKEMSP